MKSSSLTLTLWFGLLSFASCDVAALEREFEIKKPSPNFPTITIKEANGERTWQVFRSDGADFVALFNLRLTDARELLAISDKAVASYQEIVAAGRCSDGIVRSGRLGGFDRGSKMDFEVVCERNNVQVEIKMRDRYVVNFLVTRVEASQLRSYALALISKLEG